MQIRHNELVIWSSLMCSNDKKIKGMFLIKRNRSVEFHFKAQAGIPR